jgi:dihydrofolate reductase
MQVQLRAQLQKESSMKISLIVAMGRSRQIGCKGKIPWHLPSDLQNFKKVTLGHTLLLGRKTFESIGKPLPGRKTIVLTRSDSSIYKDQGCLSVKNLEEALAIAKNSGESEVFIAGGSEVYASALPFVSSLYLSLVDYDGEADTFFPKYSTKGWTQVNTESHPAKDKELAWEYQVWTR